MTQDACTSDLVLDDGAILVPLNATIPSRDAWRTLACPVCGARLLKSGKIHTLQYGWREGQEASQPTMGERIVAVRQRAGLTQGQFAAAIGESRAALSAYEHGHVVPLRILSAIAQRFQVNWVWLETGLGAPGA